MANNVTGGQKTSETPRVTSFSSDDLIIGVNDPAGLPSTVSITYGNFFANVAVVVKFSGNATFSAFSTANNLSVANLSIAIGSTPANSTQAAVQGQVWFDTSYVYVAVANNVIKRAALSTF